ncbi:quinolinate synthetase [Syntrophus gentianae]|uniref:Quinolinate synthase n=1 Tax=Syntrophus gentianae TaxID=43775 RepID=A0A1H7XT54_9BACT|nr:quinolinate synthase NadA [Syntrophus gentianae]SEM37056.1 quinolinate synthetase [Syntrophus gentianae]
MENILEKIQELKRERQAVILAHNYQRPEVQDIADYVGDSLGLSIQAASTDAKVIIFCGVHFMAETAKIFSPEKTVLIPDPDAGCPMADMITGEQLRGLKAQHPDAQVLCYVNTSAEVKAECDLCCTSANAVTMVQEVLKDAKEIIFAPDQYLAAYVAEKTGRTFIPWHGFCPTHAKILPEDVEREKARHPNAVVLAHPECRPAVTHLADIVASTEGMCRYVQETAATEIIVGTEVGIIHRMRKENPGKVFYPVSEQAVCPNMKRITLEKVLWSLQDMVHEVNPPLEIARRAYASIEKMLNYRS